jgi:hypothetical protein
MQVGIAGAQVTALALFLGSTGFILISFEWHRFYFLF